MNATSALLDLRAVDVSFGAVHALRQATLSIYAGERIALVGANGSGKSTLLRVLHGLIPPSGGQLHRSTAHTHQAMLFQRPHMLRASCQSNVALALWLRGTRWPVAKTRALQALEQVGLSPLAQRNARTLSGGQ